MEQAQHADLNIQRTAIRGQRSSPMMHDIRQWAESETVRQLWLSEKLLIASEIYPT
jgi:hypothetical protein